MQKPLTCVEICAGAGGQALGLAMAGFVHVALVEYETDYCNTLNQNRPEWNVICTVFIVFPNCCLQVNILKISPAKQRCCTD